MVQILMLIGWAVLLIILLYIWADVREIAGIVKESKRELIRGSIRGRNSGKDSQEEAEGWTAGTEEQRQQEEKQKMSGVTPLKESEEQVLKEVLTEFLG